MSLRYTILRSKLYTIHQNNEKQAWSKHATKWVILVVKSSIKKVLCFLNNGCYLKMFRFFLNVGLSVGLFYHFLWPVFSVSINDQRQIKSLELAVTTGRGGRAVQMTQIRTHPRATQQGQVKCRLHVNGPAVPTQEAIPVEGG